jgi:hypothetical protein
MTGKQLLFSLFSFLFCLSAKAQNFKIEDIKNIFGKGKPLKLTGGVSANSTYNAGNGTQGREPFVYYLNGHVNLNIYGQIDLPFSFDYTNSGSSYKLPSMPNRLSLHPSYKWITGHFGDVSMSFSPYTLSGHIFTGAGMELKPEGWDFALMYGRLLRAVEYDTLQPAVLPSYKRMGYGFKAGRTGENYQISINMLSGKDHVSSLSMPADSFGITPMENLAGSLSFMLRPVSFIEFSGEYGFSFLTSDSRAPKSEQGSFYDIWNGSNMTTSFYKALKARLDYVGANSRFGVGYERIDPEYRTLGAYYFASDLENITLNASQSLWQKKLNINASIGFEHDDLAGKKATASSKIVGSANLTAAPSERVNINLSYSNFQTFSNVRSNFELVNQPNPLDKLDTLNFVQLSQSAALNLNIVTRKDETRLHSMNINISYQDAANRQGGIYRPGSVTEMINASTSCSWTFLKSGLVLNGALNFNSSKMMNGNTVTFGPTMGFNSPFLAKKVMTGASLSYNCGYMEKIKQNEALICRINASYTPFQRHNITVAYDFQWRAAINRSTWTSLLTAGYSYNF